MATHTGKLGAVYSGTTAVAEIKDWSLDTNSEVVATTVMGDSWVTNKPTQQSWTASFNAFWDAADSGQATLVAGAELTLNLYPDGNTSEKKFWSGAVIINTVSNTASFDGLVEASFSAVGDGALTLGTVA